MTHALDDARLVAPLGSGCRLGSHRVLEPKGALPQAAWRLDNTPRAYANEILCKVETLNIDSASFKQIAEACGPDAFAIGAHILATVNERGKQHNAVTGSGGMFVGRVAEIGPALAARDDIAVGDRIASLVSLTLTPLRLDAVDEVDVATGQVHVRGTAILFESGIYARLPDDLPTDVALAVLDVAGAPAQVRRLARAGETVCVIGADGKSGMLACAQARDRVGREGRVVGIVPDAGTPAAKLVREHGYADRIVEADARDALAILAAVPDALPQLADLVVNCVNVGGTELASVLCCKDGGTVYFFSMATSFTAAALGAEGVGKDVTMMVGNGYAKGHAAVALQTLRDHPAIKDHFVARYAARRAPEQS
ncbi:MAG TPA: L-erythro-3,5-diaminohexanoate dehydrogenase [Candidatus Limnocylindrales bacterium]|nr:L-erythro-3,5-diaminohexanoate dehydrogenase [Candidatus Limnocylindrales bacterium]